MGHIYMTGITWIHCRTWGWDMYFRNYWI